MGGDLEELATDHLSLATIFMNLEKTEIWITIKKPLAAQRRPHNLGRGRGSLQKLAEVSQAYGG